MKSSEKMTILLVEDQAIIAMSEAAMLKKNGYDVIISNTGEQAIKIIEENPAINLILMDIDLGKGIDGTEAAQRILKLIEVPVVFLSNHTEKEIVDKTEKITSYGYVVKNSGETVLIASIKMAFKLFEARHKMIDSELKLIESDKKFHILEKQIDDVIWTMDMNFRFTYLSPSVEKMHGFTVDEMMKMNLQNFLPSHSVELAINTLGEHISLYLANKTETNIVTFNLDQLKKDGSIFPTEIKARFLLDNKDNPIGIIGVTRDITERLKAEEELIESKRALDLALEGAQIGFWDSNYVTGKVERSRIWASMLGYTLDEVENTSEFWRDHIHPDDFNRVIEAVEKHEKGETENFSVEHRIKTKSGKYKWILDWGKVFERTDDGNPIRAMGVHIDIDNRIKAEQKVLETNKTLNLALQGAQIGLWDQDFTSGKVKRTQYWAQMLGYDLTEISEDLDTWKLLLHPDDYDSVIKAAKDHENGLTEYFKVQHRLKCKDGGYKWILNWGKISVRDSNGNPVRAVGIHLDVDDKVKTEEALIESERRLRYSLEATNDGIWELNLRTNQVYFSPGYYRLLGYKLSEFVRGFEAWKNMIHPEDLESLENVYSQAIKTGSSYSSEYRIKNKNGKYLWVLGRGKVTEIDSGGNAIKISGSITDITNNKLAQDNLKKSQEMLRHILEQFPGVVFWKDSDSRYIGCNMAFAKGAGLSKPEEIVGKTDFDLPWAETEAQNYVDDDNQVMRLAKPKLNIEETQHQSGNEIKWFNTNKVPLLDSLGNIIGILGTSNDITDRKRAEILLRESEANLIAVINHREEAIWSIDKEYNYIIVNDVFKADYKRAFNLELKKGINALEILSEELLEFWKPKYDKALNGEVVRFEFIQKIQDQIKNFEMTLTPIISDGKIIGASGISRDITMRRAQDEEILHRKEELERFEKIVIGRELKMIELKEKISELEQRLKEYQKYDK